MFIKMHYQHTIVSISYIVLSGNLDVEIPQGVSLEKRNNFLQNI